MAPFHTQDLLTQKKEKHLQNKFLLVSNSPLMSPLPQLAPIEDVKEVPHRAAANEDYFGREACIETLNEEEIVSLFKKRKATEWMLHNRTEAHNQVTYRNEEVRIKEEMKRYNLSENDYENFLKDQGVVVD